MRFFEIVESGKIKTNILVDTLRDNQLLAREIRQIYNQCYRKDIKISEKKRYTKIWAEVTKVALKDAHLIQMIDYIIEYCSK